jgi:predicted nucleic acid-binding protein
MSVLVDTSVWITHLSKGCPELRRLLTASEVLTHPLVIGELACGNLRNRTEVLTLLRRLPAARPATDDEVLAFLGARELAGRGLGLIDVHLLASATLSHVPLWTTDKRLRDAAEGIGLAYPSLR